MKKTVKQISVLIISMSLAVSVQAKDRIIVNPAYEFSASGITYVTKIELGENETRLHIHTIFIPGWWVKFIATAYIEDCATGIKWQTTGIINGEFDKQIPMPKSGDSTFILVFPALPESVTKINFCNNDDPITIFGISLNPKTKQRSTEIPASVNKWIDRELSKAKRKKLMNFKSGEFFSKDSARLIGYINGYDPRAGFSTGIVYAGNELTGEDYPIVIKIHEDGRFEGTIPMNYPENMSVNFQNHNVNFYIQPGQTLAMMLDWNDFLMADRKRNIRYEFSNTRFQGPTAGINQELTAFKLKLPELYSKEIYGEMQKKDVDEYKSFLNTITADYTSKYNQLLSEEKLSPQARKILQDKYKMQFVSFLMEYEMSYGYSRENKKLPADFYSILQDIPMNDKEMLSTENFNVFINRFEYCSPFRIIVDKRIFPKKTTVEYLFDELGLEKTAEDLRYFAKRDSVSIIFNNKDITQEDQQKWMMDYQEESKSFMKRYESKLSDYNEKYLKPIRQLQNQIMADEWRAKDSVYQNVLKLSPGIVYDITKVRALNFIFTERMQGNKEDSKKYLDGLLSDIREPFLKEEAKRIYNKNFPADLKKILEKEK
ncbi:MAG: hypothetical protein LBT50_04915 [Prevotellaceae bacterium]|jgi:hypothetical protein|nr:hypothetical protein [Prevotellaceae bacterium]